MDAVWDAVLPEGVARAQGPPTAPPVDYEDGFVLPAHTDKPLKALHPHPLDARLYFFEEPHVYTFDGVPTSASVTALAHEYEKPFCAADAVAGMKTARSQAWPRAEYVEDLRPLDDAYAAARGVLLVRGGKTVATLPPYALEVGTTTASALAVLRASAVRGAGGDVDDDELFTYTRGLEADEIDALWKRKGRIASHRGTDAHWLAECFFNGLPVRWWEEEMRLVVEFARTSMIPHGLLAHSTEKEIVCADADLAGSIDLLAVDPATGVIHIIDHKRSDKLRATMRGYSKMAPPFSHLDDCKGAAYALQTSIYQYVLERDYGMVVGDRVLLSLHPDAPFATSVPYLKDEVSYLMERRMAVVRARRAVADAEPERFRCALTGAPATDAVRLDDGRIAMEKAAQVADPPVHFAPDKVLRAAFEAAVAEHATLPSPPTALLSWRRRMPEGGVVPFA